MFATTLDKFIFKEKSESKIEGKIEERTTVVKNKRKLGDSLEAISLRTNLTIKEIEYILSDKKNV